MRSRSSFPLLPKVDRRLLDPAWPTLNASKSVSLDVAVYYCFPTFVDARHVVVYYRFTTSFATHNVAVYSPWGCILPWCFITVFVIGRAWFSTCESGPFPFCAWLARGFKLNIYMRICRCIYMYYCHIHIVIFLYMKHQQDRTSEVSYLDAKQKHLV